jgi:hypothetical protein
LKRSRSIRNTAARSPSPIRSRFGAIIRKSLTLRRTMLERDAAARQAEAIARHDAHRAQDRVAGGVAVEVVDGLEAVEVDQEHRGALALALFGAIIRKSLTLRRTMLERDAAARQAEAIARRAAARKRSRPRRCPGRCR